MATARRGSTASGRLTWQPPQPIQSTTFPLKGQAPPPVEPPPVEPPHPPEPPPMPPPTLSAEVKTRIAQFAARFPLPQGTPGAAHEDACRAWTVRLAEQLNHDFGPEYGAKRADMNRPLSKDSFARREPNGLSGWDVMLGAGTGRPTLNASPGYTDITGQVFVTVFPVNYLGVPPEPPPEPPEPPPPPPPPAPGPSVSYQQFVGVEAQQVADKYRAVHGRVPAPSDLYHNAWRRLVEGWSHQAILDDIR